MFNFETDLYKNLYAFPSCHRHCTDSIMMIPLSLIDLQTVIGKIGLVAVCKC